MPSTYAHRRFGTDVAERLPASARVLVNRHRELYDIGLHGPDIFFYYHALQSNPVVRMGFDMHERPGEEFFAKARQRIPKADDPEAALAYILGFICHFALDSTCHPYIEQYTRETGVGHYEIETELETMLLQRDGKDPFTYFAASHIRPTIYNAKVIAPFFDEVSLNQTYETLKGMVLVLRGLQASNPLKRQVILAVMRAAHKDDMLGLVTNAKPNPACAASNQHLLELYGQALPLAEQLILEYIDAQHNTKPLDKAYQHTFGEF